MHFNHNKSSTNQIKLAELLTNANRICDLMSSVPDLPKISYSYSSYSSYIAHKKADRQADADLRCSISQCIEFHNKKNIRCWFDSRKSMPVCNSEKGPSVSLVESCVSPEKTGCWKHRRRRHRIDLGPLPLSRRGWNPIKLAYKLAGWPAQLAASALMNCQYANSPGHRAYFYAELAETIGANLFILVSRRRKWHELRFWGRWVGWELGLQTTMCGGVLAANAFG